jgi:hypothetical protein
MKFKKNKRKMAELKRVYKKMHLEICEQMGLDPRKIGFGIAKSNNK